MTSAKSKTPTEELLDHLYQGLKASSQTLLALLSKCNSEDVSFQSELTLLLNDTESLANRVGAESGKAAQDKPLLTKLSARLTAAIATLMDTSASHMAELLIRESTDRMTENVKMLRELENTTASQASLALAREAIALDERCIERLKAYL